MAKGAGKTENHRFVNNKNKRAWILIQFALWSKESGHMRIESFEQLEREYSTFSFLELLSPWSQATDKKVKCPNLKKFEQRQMGQ